MLGDRELAQLVLGHAELHDSDIAQCELEGLMSMIPSCTESAREKQQELIYRAVAWETAHRRVVSDLLAKLHSHNIPALIIKGTALAYSIYAEPWQRSRVDTDLLVQEAQVDDAIEVLESSGFEAGVSLPGRVAFAELAFSFTDEFGVVHTIDLHWRLNNNWRLAGAIQFGDLWRESLPLPAFCDDSFWPGIGASMLIACIHRAAHLTEVAYERPWGNKMASDLTLWIYDIHLLSRQMSEGDWQMICERAIEARLSLIVGDALQLGEQMFDSEIPKTVMAQLHDARNQVTLDQLARQAAGEVTSLKAIPSWHQKIQFMKEQLFPAAGYMKARYPGDWLAWAYVKRICSGLLGRAGT